MPFPALPLFATLAGAAAYVANREWRRWRRPKGYLTDREIIARLGW
jgi:hypothetical protein